MTVSHYKYAKYYHQFNIIAILNLTLNRTIYFQASSQAKAMLLGILWKTRDRGLDSKLVIQCETTILENGTEIEIGLYVGQFC